MGVFTISPPIIKIFSQVFFKKLAESRDSVPWQGFGDAVPDFLFLIPNCLLAVGQGCLDAYRRHKSRPMGGIGNPRRGFPTPKQYTGLFRLPSCGIFAKGNFALCGGRHKGFALVNPTTFEKVD